MLTYAMIYEALNPIFNEYLADFDGSIEEYSAIFQPKEAIDVTFNQYLLPFARQESRELTRQDYVSVARILLSNEATHAANYCGRLAQLRNALPRHIADLHRSGFMSEESLALIESNSSPGHCAYVIALVSSKGFLSNELAMHLIKHKDTYHLANIFHLLDRIAQLNSKNISLLLKYEFLNKLYSTLKKLEAAQLFYPALVNYVLSLGSKHEAFANSAVIIHQAGLLNTEILSELRQIFDRGHIQYLQVIKVLQTTNSLTCENVAATTKYEVYSASRSIIHTFQILKNANLFNQARVTAILNHERIDELEYTCENLLTAGLFNEQYLNDVINSHSPANLASAFATLNRLGLLTPKNRQAVMRLKIRALKATVWIMNQLPATEPFNQNNIDRLVKNTNFIYLFNKHGVMNFIPDDAFTQAHFDGLFNAYTRANDNNQDALAAMRAYVTNRILNNRPNHANAVNAQQSTHTASVHQSVSESAIRLRKKYPFVSLDQPIAQMVTWGNALDTTSSSNMQGSMSAYQNAAAQRAITRICSHGSAYGNYVDKKSHTSTQQLLALIWYAIHDEHNRMGTLEDAKSLLRDGLYECQREYNLNAQGKDNQPQVEDRPACTAGTFNKLMEKMQGVLPQVEIRMINQQTASLKLPIVVKDVLAAHLRDHANQAKLIDSIKQDGVEPVWSEIKYKVAEVMFAEFSSLYGSDLQNTHFIDLVETGIYVTIDDEWLDKIPKANSHKLSPLSSTSMFHHTSSSSSSTQYYNDGDIEPAPKRRKIS